MSDLQSAGALLRAARESSGLHVAALAVAMKVPVKKLEALEADRLDLLPDAVFVRALASSVCRALKIDAAPILEKLPQSTIPRLDTEMRGINAPFHAPGQSTGISVPDFFAKPAVLAVLALLLGVGVLALFPEPKTPAQPVETAVAMVPVPSVPATDPIVERVPKLDEAMDSPVVVPVKPVAEAGRTEPIPAGAEVAGQTAGVVAFRARGTSWVEVTDAKGVVQLRKTLVSGERVATSGVLPLSVVVGRADVTQVEVRGKEFALDAITKDNVARFEVK
jgi:cytoskeleton protein RodZ